MIPDRLDFFCFRMTFLDEIALVSGLVLSVLFLANDALDLNLGLDCLALILLATSMGFIQVAGSETTLPLRGPDVHLNFFLSPFDFLFLPNTCSPASSSTCSQGYSSQSFIA